MSQKLLSNFKLQIIIKVSDAKWLGINGYFAGKKLKKNCACRCGPKNLPLQGSKFTHIFNGGGGIQLSVRIYSPVTSKRRDWCCRVLNWRNWAGNYQRFFLWQGPACRRRWPVRHGPRLLWGMRILSPPPPVAPCPLYTLRRRLT